MKRIQLLFLFIFVSGSILTTNSFASAAPRAGQASVEAGMRPEAVNVKPETVKRKKNKGYKKPKRKKFLGIFKRKSSCDCPRH